MLEQQSVSEAFAICGISGDSAAYPNKPKEDGHVAHVDFKCTELEVSVYVFTDGTYEAVAERLWRGDLEDAARCYARAGAFVRLLRLKARQK